MTETVTQTEYATGSHDGFDVSSNTDDAETIQAILEAPEGKSDQGHDPAKVAGQDPSPTDPEETAASEDRERGPDGKFLKAEEKPLGKPRNDPKARMLEATRKEAEAKTQAKALQAERDALKAENERLKRPPVTDVPPSSAPRQEVHPPLPAGAAAKPDANDPKWKSWEEYTEALTDWKIAATLTEREAKAQEARKLEEFGKGVERVVQSFRGRLQEALKDESFKQVLEELGQHLIPSVNVPQGQRLTPTNVMADEIVVSERGPEIMRYLHSNPDHFQRIATLQDPRQISREMAKIEAYVEKAEDAAPTATAPKAVSTARPPVRPVTGGPSNAEVEVTDDMPLKEYARIMNARDAKERRQRH